METTKSTQRSRKRRIKDPQQSKYSRNKNQTQKYHSLTQPTDRPETPEQILPNPKENTRPHKFSHTHSKESKWNAYEENEDHSEDENTIHNPINDTTSKPNNMISKSSKWSTYMEEELDSDSDMPPTYAYSHIPQPRPPILSQTTANNDFSICSNDISSPTIFSQDTLVDTPPCKISTGTKAKLSKFAFVKKKSPIKPTLETTSPRKPDLPVEAQQQLYSSEDQVEYKKQENELNELDALEIEEFDPFNM
ncbi:hypothetical protein K7432_013610 [Basidiobolus ranarum]|uniref:Uncharacterized protein n=1 Tax=Basidiobolus ranarum TaxID=34480 RepID=A0ABR2WIY1_9FUNG